MRPRDPIAAIDRSPVAPQRVEKLQLVRWLHNEGLLATVKAAVDGNADAKREWEAAANIRCGGKIANGVATILGLDEAGVDAMFRGAAKL